MMTNQHMQTKHYLLFTFLMAITTSSVAVTANPVTVKTYGQHIGGNIVYNYQVTNNNVRSIVGFGVADNDDSAELNEVLPLGCDASLSFPAGSVSAPAGWRASIEPTEQGLYYLEWNSPGYPQPGIQQGQIARFSVTVPKMDKAYLTSHFSAGYADGNEPWHYIGVMEKLDTTSPVLSFTLNPAATSAIQRGQMVAINALISVTDDYDPAPEIKLESITVSESALVLQVQDAQTGTDDRSFSLLAIRNNPTVARIYNITYSATDASGNVSRSTVAFPVN